MVEGNLKGKNSKLFDISTLRQNSINLYCVAWQNNKPRKKAQSSKNGKLTLKNVHWAIKESLDSGLSDGLVI